MTAEHEPFATNERRGFWLNFRNGWTVSVQWGPGTYGSNYGADFEGRDERPWSASEAEVWAWNERGSEPGEPLAYQTPEQVADFIAAIRHKRKSRAKAKS